MLSETYISASHDPNIHKRPRVRDIRKYLFSKFKIISFLRIVSIPNSLSISVNIYEYLLIIIHFFGIGMQF